MLKKLLSAVVISLMATTSFAQGFDRSKPLSVIVPFNPGGGTDLIFRNFQRYSERVGVSVQPIYKPGANGIIGVRELANTSTSGNTIGLAPSQSVAETIVKDSSITYTTVSGVASSLWVVAVNSNSDIKTFADLSTRLKSNQKTVFGSGATGQLNMINQILEKLKLSEMPIVAPFNGAAPAVTNLLGGHIDVIVVPISTVFKQLEAGNLRPIAVIGKVKGYESLPNLQKLFPDWKEHDIFGFILPKNVSQEGLEFWSNHIKAYLTDPKVREELEKEYAEPVKFGASNFDRAVNLSKELVK